MIDKEIIAVFHYDDKGSKCCGSEPYRYAEEIIRCKECRKSHIDGKTTHYLWCAEWGRSTDTFGYCERGEREGE